MVRFSHGGNRKCVFFLLLFSSFEHGFLRREAQVYLKCGFFCLLFTIFFSFHSVFISFDIYLNTLFYFINSEYNSCFCFVRIQLRRRKITRRDLITKIYTSVIPESKQTHDTRMLPMCKWLVKGLDGCSSRQLTHRGTFKFHDVLSFIRRFLHISITS